jgi:G3E family GTPase
MAAVAVDIVSGFLGSGKTTLLRHVLSHGLRGTKVAVVVNEIGEIGIDGQVITGLDAIDAMVELSTGCICCSIDEHRFDVAMQELLETARPDLVLIEATGLAEPAALASRVRGAGLRVDALITVVDASNVERCLRDTSVARLQIAAADFVVLNKLDLCDRPMLERVRRRIERLNPRAVRLEAVHGAVATPLLFAPGVAAYRRAAGRAQGTPEPGHLDRDGIGAFMYRSQRRLRQEGFERVVARLPRDVYRAKGIVRFADRDLPCLFNYTCGRTDLSWIDLPEIGDESQLVVIGREQARYRTRVLRQLTRCEVATATAV